MAVPTPLEVPTTVNAKSVSRFQMARKVVAVKVASGQGSADPPATEILTSLGTKALTSAKVRCPPLHNCAYPFVYTHARCIRVFLVRAPPGC